MGPPTGAPSPSRMVVRTTWPGSQATVWMSWVRLSRIWNCSRAFGLGIEVAADVGEDAALGLDVVDEPGVQCGMLAAQCEQLAVERERRTLVGGFGGDVGLEKVRIDRQPGRAGGEAGVCGGVPQHGSALRVAAHADAGLLLLGRVLDLVGSDAAVGHLQLLAVVEGGGAAQGEQQHGGGAGLGLAEAAGGAGLVVVAHDPVRPGACGERGLVVADEGGDLVGVPLGLDEVEVEGHLCAVEVAAVVLDEVRDGEVDLADEDAVGVVVEDGPHLGDDGVVLGLVGGVGGQDAPELVGAGVPLGVGQVVAELLVLDEQPEDVHAEAVDAAIQPEAHGGVDGRADLGIVPVEVGLLLEEGVEVELAGGLVEGPAGAAEVALPVVGDAAIGGGIAPEIPVALGVVAGCPAFEEPGVLVGAVVGDEVEDQLQAAGVRGGDQAVEVGERAEEGIDAGVVGDVVAEVGHGRGVERRDPDGLDAELDEVVEPRFDAGEIADAVAVAVLKRTRVDLVDRTVLPPLPCAAHAAVYSPALPIRKLILCGRPDVRACRPARRPSRRATRCSCGTRRDRPYRVYLPRCDASRSSARRW